MKSPIVIFQSFRNAPLSEQTESPNPKPFNKKDHWAKVWNLQTADGEPSHQSRLKRSQTAGLRTHRDSWRREPQRPLAWTLFCAPNGKPAIHVLRERDKIQQQRRCCDSDTGVTLCKRYADVVVTRGVLFSLTVIENVAVPWVVERVPLLWGYVTHFATSTEQTFLLNRFIKVYGSVMSDSCAPSSSKRWSRRDV